MKIAVKDLEPNPYRKMERYPIDRTKIESLKISISDTSFWDNILARPHPTKQDKYQIAYGHHRFIALKELGIKQVDIPVRKLDDVKMVKIMAEENLNWETSPRIINETILAAKEFLDEELKKYIDLGTSPKYIRCLFAGETGFSETKTKGAGQPILLKFLGGNWKKHTIDDALDTLHRDKKPVDQGGIDRKAVEELPTVRRAKAFKESVRRYKIDKPLQRKIAKEIKEKDVGSMSIPSFVAKRIPPAKRQASEDSQLSKIKEIVEGIDSISRQLYNKLMVLRREMEILNIEQLKGVKVWLAAGSLKQLFKELERLKGKESL